MLLLKTDVFGIGMHSIVTVRKKHNCIKTQMHMCFSIVTVSQVVLIYDV